MHPFVHVIRSMALRTEFGPGVYHLGIPLDANRFSHNRYVNQSARPLGFRDQSALDCFDQNFRIINFALMLVALDRGAVLRRG